METMTPIQNEAQHDERKIEITIIVNTRPKKWDKKEISFQEVVALAYGSYEENPDIEYTVSYKHGKLQGTLVKDETTPVREGMIFHVSRTNKS